MENVEAKKESAPFKLNYKRTFTIALAFFGIMLLWQVYNTYCSPMLTELFKNAMGVEEETEVQYLVGVVMALDNLAALVMLPIFGRLSDKTHTKIGKRMPYIMIGTIVAAIAFPFIPLLYYYNSLGGTIAIMAVVVFFMMMYRNPAVALMPDVTPKPLRSRANGIINSVGFVGGIVGTGLAMLLSFSKYFQYDKNLLLMEVPFIVSSVLMIASCLFLFFKIDENKLAEEMAPELERGEKYAEAQDEVVADRPMSKKNKITLILVLAAEVLWYMGFNAVETFITNYGIYYLEVNSSSVSVATMILSISSFISFLLGGLLAEKIGRKWTIAIGIGLVAIALFVGIFIPPSETFTSDGYRTFPILFYFIFIIAGIGWAFINTCSFPMVVELCSKEKVGQFTGYYYAAAMFAQSLTPIAVGGVLYLTGAWRFLFIYSASALALSFLIFLFVKAPRNKGIKAKKGLEALDGD